ncbi:cytochrome c oxidase-assembly factor cox-23, mitochondrial [Linderina pennispora]|uniref:Cytochrome c oxidase-assembly factor COX23, mitochondrial n=1 Tax=Linderina pennispora TaxID=61395 RepID=A0A1Y1WDW6_9FUNG|nr:cytochrome c oxidase-assembly factor cox-23, mitochondrial [Linderina pennispora]ORX71585.1 cytochrome c oxidase-assembly factor cox-23, mitochondrial [Linderina pennispora]
MSDTTSDIRGLSNEKEPRRITLREFENKKSSKFMDPCGIEAKASFKCLDDNNYDKSLCNEYFEAYRNCKQMWVRERRKARHDKTI